MNKLINIVVAVLLFGPIAMGFAYDDGAVAHANKTQYSAQQ